MQQASHVEGIHVASPVHLETLLLSTEYAMHFHTLTCVAATCTANGMSAAKTGDTIYSCSGWYMPEPPGRHVFSV